MLQTKQELQEPNIPEVIDDEGMIESWDDLRENTSPHTSSIAHDVEECKETECFQRMCWPRLDLRWSKEGSWQTEEYSWYDSTAAIP